MRRIAATRWMPNCARTIWSFRNLDDYLSAYRRVLDYFDSTKCALTATPACHTREIFGAPVFHYGYRQAVIDGYLIDHRPPRRITTALSQTGITFDKGEEVNDRRSAHRADRPVQPR
jgi:type I restriction enzyme R subunit